MRKIGNASSRRRVVLFIAAVLPAIVLLYRLFTRDPPIERLTYNVLQAAVDGNSHFVARYLPQYELDKLGMTRVQAERFLGQYILPKFKGCRLRRVDTMRTSGGELRGVVDVDLGLPNGDTASTRLTMDQSDDGPIVFLHHILHIAWITEFIEVNKPRYRDAINIEAPLWELRRSKSQLLAYGFCGFVNERDEAAPLTPLDRAEHNLAYYASRR